MYSSSTYWIPSLDDNLSPNPSRLRHKYTEKTKRLMYNEIHMNTTCNLEGHLSRYFFNFHDTSTYII